MPIQYRLGSLGILGDGTTEFSGNAALFDMAAAMRWVHEYIHFFGGDPQQIVVMGQGSGAQAATYLTTTQMQSREMVSGVVAMSGSAYTQNSIDNAPKQSSKEIIAINNCQRENETEIVKCLRQVSRTFEVAEYFRQKMYNLFKRCDLLLRKTLKILFAKIRKYKWNDCKENKSFDR